TLATVGNVGVAVADLNRDNWLDLVLPVYSTGTSRSWVSPIFWGGPEGYSEKRITQLPSNGGTGSLTADFNLDGFPDLLMINHRSEGDPSKLGAFGDHTSDSWIYWGSAGGFQKDRKLGIPAEGPHYDYGLDLGNIYDRSYEFQYVSSGYACNSKVPIRIEWNG